MSKLFSRNQPPARPDEVPGSRSVWAVGSVILDDYLIEKELGHGGMGRVWLVRSKSTGNRFAVKQALIRDDKHRKAFLAELQSWIDLPEHPNIVPCRFFRTVCEEIVVFADYVDGGSLAEWIANRRLTTLEDIVKVAIQFADGIQVIHQRGLIHQDVKPGNVLMTGNGVPKVTDFGLARARMQTAARESITADSSGGQQNILVSTGGMTLAYASPEQRAGHPLSRKTDIWSWGVSVLDMFTGGVSCPHGGQIAAEVLESFIEDGQTEADLPEMPEDIARILRKCFAHDAECRWRDFTQVRQALRSFFPVSGNAPENAFRQLRPAAEPNATDGPSRSDMTMGGVQWASPQHWIQIAVQRGVLTDTESQKIAAAKPESRKARVVADLAVYDQIEERLRRLTDQRSGDAMGLLGMFFFDKALILTSAGDLPGAQTSYSQAVHMMEEALRDRDDHAVASCLVSAHMNRSVVLQNLGRFDEAINSVDSGIALGKELMESEWWWSWDDLAGLYFTKANIMRVMDRLDKATEFYDETLRVLENFQKLVDLAQENVRPRMQSRCDHLMAVACTNKAIVLRTQGKPQEAVSLYDKAIEIRERQLRQPGGKVFSNFLAMAYMNKALAVGRVGNLADALTLADQGIGIWESLRMDGNDQALTYLAVAYKNKASFAEDARNSSLALSLYQQALRAYRHLVVNEGRGDLAKAMRVVEERIRKLSVAEQPPPASASPPIARPVAPRSKTPPRKHHYTFAHQLLPAVFFNDPMKFITAFKENGSVYLWFCWDQVGRTLPENERMPKDSLDFRLVALKGNITALVIVLPPPVGMVEAHYVALLHRPKRPEDQSALTRVIALEHSADKDDNFMTCLCEWCPGEPKFSHINYGAGPEPGLDRFIDAVGWLLER